ncbi:MAG TPA: SIR2 family protein [Anaeromyxobacter sp.]|nr:SIR2 family protein [Anaeromyxobacter sp.]
MPDPRDVHLQTVAKAVLDGRVIFFLGAGVNRCGRPLGVQWDLELRRYLPDGRELAEYLARQTMYPQSDASDLLRVSQYLSVMEGSGPLYERLHQVFDADYPPTSVHQLLSCIPALLRARGPVAQYPLIVTTNYDDLMERALREAHEEYELVVYVADGHEQGKFVHSPPGEDPRIIEVPNEYGSIGLDRRTVVMKIHGSVDRQMPDRDSFVITEDHYIDYLTRTDLGSLVPVVLAAKLRRSHFLFLGYGLRDWNLRVILHRITREQTLSYKSWAIQFRPDELEQKFWENRKVEILDVPLEQYVEGLHGKLEPPPPPAPPPPAAEAQAGTP